MSKNRKLSVSALMLWAGLAIGGNLIAAPAKFQVSTLSLGELLQVGRAQFAWLGLAELFLAGMVLVLLLAERNWPSKAFHAALALLAVQQLLLQPMLQARSDVIVAGGSAAQSHLHLVFIAVEIAKIGLLICASLSGPRAR